MLAASIILADWVVILATAVLFTVQSSRGDQVLWKPAKFLGIVASFLPIIGAIMWVIFRHRPSGFGRKCGAMAIIGLCWFVVLQQLRKAL